MLRGLARWLRAAGYDASWTYGIDDAALLAHARVERRMVLTADGGIVRSRAVRAHGPPVLYVPNALPPVEQARGVLRSLRLPVEAARCLACGGELVPVPKSSVRDEAPPRSYDAYEHFYRCARCSRLLWHGTHWERIARTLDDLRQR